jgi:transcriptional regulator with XRE-family HTH domain
MANNDDNRTLGEVIRDARTKAKLGLRELARKLSITPSYQSDIEYDRRVPSEEVLRATADELNLDFDDLMARAGRFGEQADRYLKKNPIAGALFRTISEDNLSEEALIELRRKAEELVKKKRKERG